MHRMENKMKIMILSLFAVIEIAFIIVCLTRKANRKPVKYISALIAVILLFFTVWMLILPKYELPKATGPYPVKSEIHFYSDNKRVETYSNTGENRSLQVKIWYPDDAKMKLAGTCPLIVFSHGSFGVKESNVSLFNELASNGYVVCSIDHTYQCFSTTDKNGKKINIDKGFLKEVMKENSDNKKETLAYFQKWMGVRTADINFVLDTILSSAEKNPNQVFGLIDKSKIGLIGHSLGGSAVLGVGRMRKDVSAVISLEAPFMCDILGVENNEFVWNKQAYPVPVFNVYSDSTWSHLGEWKQYAENDKLIHLKQENNFTMHLKGAGHMTLTDMAYVCPLFCLINGQDIFLDVNQTVNNLNGNCKAFFDVYLKSKGTFIIQKNQ